jgi:CheY-like chemotaxis protein
MQRESSKSLLASAADVDLSSIASAPEGLQFENLRRRGIDVVRIRWASGNRRRWFRFFGFRRRRAVSADSVTLTFVDSQVHIQGPSGAGGNRELRIPMADITDVSIAAGGEGRTSVVVAHKGGSFALGEGLNDECRTWLRDRIVMETAGLTWKPLYNVGKRSTRQTSRPEDDKYRLWSSSQNRLIDLFLSQAVSKCEEMRAALSSGDHKAARSGAHWMKSSSAAIGAAQLSELCQRLEIDLDAKDAIRIANIAPHVFAEFEKVEASLKGALDTADNDLSSPALVVKPPVETQGCEVESLSGLSVLIVEDSRVNQEIARDCLERAGASVETVDDALSAIRKHELGSFDLILMDCQMSGMDGFAATRAIRESDRCMGRRPIPIIALTANALRDDRALCLAAGMNEYLSKPFIDADLIKAVSEWSRRDESRPYDVAAMQSEGEADAAA